MSKLVRLVPAELDDAQRDLYDAVAGGPRAQGPQHFALTRPDGSLTGPFNVLLHAPDLGQAVQALGAAIRFESTLTARVRELAILAVAVHVDSRFEWDAHAAIGRAIGITEAELAAVCAGQIPSTADGEERAALTFVHAALAGSTAPAGLGLSPHTQVELATLVGYYSMLALYMRVFDTDEAAEPPR